MTVDKIKELCIGLTGHPPSTIFAGVLVAVWFFLEFKYPEFTNYFEKGTGLSAIAYLALHKGKKQ